MAGALSNAALEYAGRGWVVFPLHSPTARGCSCGRAECESPGKHPRTAHGLKDASRDSATIREWWRRWPDANIGIATGPESGILVLDVDGKQGEESLIQLKRSGCQLPDTFTVKTGGGGQHAYYRWPGGVDVRNSQSKIALGLDIRGQGGYVVAPPSLHASGARYEINESAILPAPCPEIFLSLIDSAQSAQTRQSAPAAGVVASAPIVKGGRTKHLVSVAGTMHKRGMDPAAIEAALLAENAARCSPPLPENKVRAIARDVPARYPNAMPEEKPSMKPDLVCLADVEARPVDWLWEPFIPLRMLSMISGDPGAGKSFVALAVAADLSRGMLRDGRIVEPANTLYLTVENPTAEVMRPRFDSLGGDPSRLHLLKGTSFEVNSKEQHGAVSLADIAVLDDAIVGTNARLVIVDPLQSYLGASVDLHRSNETRPVMDGLAKLAERHGLAILLLRHLSKQAGGKAIHRGLGSIDLTGAVRSELLAGSLPDDPETRALVHIKSNVGRFGKALGYAIDSKGCLAWTGESGVTEADLLAAPAGPGDHKLAEAAQWLTRQLRRGGREQREIRQAAEAAGISYATLRRAKDALRIRAHKAGLSGPWMWSLSEDAHDSPEDAQEKCVSTFVKLSTFDSDCGGLLQ
jgi:Bifunctional DNA primase/polymerase, N-terminal/AAA domain/Primase C terminal 1 (PriCT-1)